MQDGDDAEQKKFEQDQIKKARRLIAKNDKISVEKAGDILFELLKEIYGKKCMRHWAFSHYIKLNETAPTYLGTALEEYLLKTREIQ